MARENYIHSTNSYDRGNQWEDAQNEIFKRREEIYSRLISTFPEHLQNLLREVRYAWSDTAAFGMAKYLQKDRTNRDNIIRFYGEPLQRLLGENLVGLYSIPHSSVPLGEARKGSDIDGGVLLTVTPLSENEKDEVISLLTQQGFHVEKHQPETTLKGFKDKQLTFYALSDGEIQDAYDRKVVSSGFELISGHFRPLEALIEVFDDPDLPLYIKTYDDYLDFWFYVTTDLPDQMKRIFYDRFNHDYYQKLPKAPRKEKSVNSQNISVPENAEQETVYLKFSVGKEIVLQTLEHNNITGSDARFLEDYANCQSVFDAKDIWLRSEDYGLNQENIPLIDGYFFDMSTGAVAKNA